MRHWIRRSTLAAFLVVLAIVGTARAGNDDGPLPRFVVRWTKKLDAGKIEFEVRSKGGRGIEAAWKLPGAVLDPKGVHDTSKDAARAVTGELEPKLAEALAAELTAKDLLVPVEGGDPDGAAVEFDLDIDGRTLRGTGDRFPTVRRLLNACAQVAFEIAPPPPFTTIAVASRRIHPGEEGKLPGTRGGIPVDAGVHIHAHGSPWGPKAADGPWVVRRTENDRQVAEWNATAEQRALIEKLYDAARLPVGGGGEQPAVGEDIYILLVTVSPEGMARNAFRSRRVGRPTDSDLVVGLLSLRPPEDGD